MGIIIIIGTRAVERSEIGELRGLIAECNDANTPEINTTSFYGIPPMTELERIKHIVIHRAKAWAQNGLDVWIKGAWGC